MPSLTLTVLRVRPVLRCPSNPTSPTAPPYLLVSSIDQQPGGTVKETLPLRLQEIYSIPILDGVVPCHDVAYHC